MALEHWNVYMSRLMTKPIKWHVRLAKTQISLDTRPVWSEYSLSAWRNIESLATHWAHSEDSDQNGRMPRLIWVFAGRTVILLVLSWGGSHNLQQFFLLSLNHTGKIMQFHNVCEKGRYHEPIKITQNVSLTKWQICLLALSVLFAKFHWLI